MPRLKKIRMVKKMAKIIDGKIISAAVREEIKAESEKFFEEYGKRPGLAVIIVGDNSASQVYVRNKKRACEEVGFNSEIYALPTETTTEQIEKIITLLSEDKNTHGILVQLPLPEHIDEKKIISLIPPEKDVDAFHPQNVGKIMIGEYNFLPCTPAGVMKMLEYENISVDGKICVVVGRSNIVGKPMSMLLLNKNGTVVTCHSHTKNLPDITKQADILVSCVGKKGFITADMVKSGAVVIDVGINRDENGKICGDVDFDSVKEKASAITPVPGGVGVMTVTMLLENTLRAAKLSVK